MVYFIATPIGNLKDISLRALDTLKQADVVFCEDTRHTLKLMNAYSIKKPLKSCHKFNEREASERIIACARGGQTVCVVSDAGMPVVSDPGEILRDALKEAGVEYTVIPGANAFLSALVLSDLPASRFAFLGFLPEKATEAKRLLERVKDIPLTLCVHCAPQDIDKTVALAYSVLGDRRACAVREITKIHEESVSFTLKEGLAAEKRGEYVLLIDGAAERENPLNALSVKEHIERYMSEGMDKMSAVKKVAKDRGVSKSEIYAHSIDIGEKDEQ